MAATIFQDLKEKHMKSDEIEYKKQLEATGHPVEEIFAEFFEYKTQQLSFILQEILREEQLLAENFNGF